MTVLLTILQNSAVPVDLSGSIGQQILNYVVKKNNIDPYRQGFLSILLEHSATKLPPTKQCKLDGRLLMRIMSSKYDYFLAACMGLSAKHALGNQFDLNGAVGAKALKKAIKIDIVQRSSYGFIDILMDYAPKGSNCHLNLGSDAAHKVVENVVKKRYLGVLQKLLNYQPKNGKNDYKVDMDKTNSRGLTLLAIAQQQLEKDKNNNKEKCQEIINLLEWYEATQSRKSYEEPQRSRFSCNKTFHWDNAKVVGFIMLSVVVVRDTIVLISKKYKAAKHVVAK